MDYQSHPQPLNQLATKHQQLPKVLIIRPPTVFKSVETEFSQKFHLVKAWESPLPLDQFLAAHAHDVRAMLDSGVTPVNPDVLRHLPSLRCIVTSSAGIDRIDLPECRRRGIFVANAGAVFSEDVADTAVALLIDVLRRVVAADRYVRGGNWLVKGDYPLGSKVISLSHTHTHEKLFSYKKSANPTLKHNCVWDARSNATYMERFGTQLCQEELCWWANYSNVTNNF